MTNKGDGLDQAEGTVSASARANRLVGVRHTMANGPAAVSSQRDEPGGRVLPSVRSLLSFETLIGVFGCWTVGFWIALAFGRGWMLSLVLTVLVVTALLATGLWPTPQPRRSATRRGSHDGVALAVVLAIVLLWPLVEDVGRATVAGVAIGCLGARLAGPAIAGRVTAIDRRLMALIAIAALAATAFEASWTTSTLLLCALAGLVVIRPGYGADRSAKAAATTTPSQRLVPVGLLTGFGLLLAGWFSTAPFYSEDNTYYLNKAAHFAASPRSFEVKDYMYGVDGATHFPIGNVLSSFEPLVGLLSAITGASAPTILFQVIVPLSMVLVPFAVRYAAQGLGLPRPDLAAGLAVASILLMTNTPTATLFAQASYGKMLSRLLLVPLVLGASGYLVRHRDGQNSARVTLAGIGAVGLSPSLGPAVLLILVPFGLTGLANVWRTRRRGTANDRAGQMLPLAIPAWVITAFALFGRRLQASAGDVQTTLGFKNFPSPERAWLEAFARSKGSGWLTLVLLLGSTAVFPLLSRHPLVRRATGVMILLIFGVIFAPWSFDPVVNDLLDLNYFAWRFLWAIPAGLVVGAAAAALDGRRRIGLLTIAAATLGMGLSGPSVAGTSLALLRPESVDVRDAPTWPWEAGIPDSLLEPAHSIIDVTPDGARFLAPAQIEQVTAAIHIDAFPVFLREVYLIPIGSSDPPPPGFELEDRMLLGAGIAGTRPDATADDWRQALGRLEVATVCLDPRSDPTLRRVVEAGYSSRGSAGACELWVTSPR